MRASDAPPAAKPVCRFYSRGVNSHFYTGDASECQALQSLEQRQRADATAKGQGFQGWQYEGVVFYALVPTNGQCPGGTTPVYRMYNNRAMQNDTNHRFTADGVMHAAMEGWVDEGVAFCSPS
jgi:serine protease